MCDSSERGLASQSDDIVCYLSGIELPPIIEDHGARDTEACDDVLPNKFKNLGGSDGSHCFGLNPLYEVIHGDKEVLVLPCGFRERP